MATGAAGVAGAASLRFGRLLRPVPRFQIRRRGAGFGHERRRFVRPRQWNGRRGGRRLQIYRSGSGTTERVDARSVVAPGHGSRPGALAASPLLCVSISAAQRLGQQRKWALRSVDERPSMADAALHLKSCLVHGFRRRAAASPYLHLESWLVHGSRLRAQQLCRGPWWPRWVDGLRMAALAAAAAAAAWAVEIAKAERRPKMEEEKENLI
ncbi:hypothetical protein NL676_019881 [Syzygium grande]|nr:hypothetical protein NL676_019881 [Syzygium grande]